MNVFFFVLKIVLYVFFFFILIDIKLKFEIMINYLGFIFYYLLGCILIELYIN